VVSSLYHLKDPQHNNEGRFSVSNLPAATVDLFLISSDAGFFVFPDLSVRTEGSYRLKLSLFEVVG